MPSLQVRDVPQDIYDRFKEIAKSNHRSISQEAMFMLEKRCYPEKFVEPQKSREEILRERVEQRRQIFARLDEMNKNRKPIPLEEMDRIWKESREEWERRTDCSQEIYEMRQTW